MTLQRNLPRIFIPLLLNFVAFACGQTFPFNLGLANDQLIIVEYGVLSPLVQTPQSVENLPVPGSVHSIDLFWVVLQEGIDYQISTAVLDQTSLTDASNIMTVNYT
jgi:hypothetical protein